MKARGVAVEEREWPRHLFGLGGTIHRPPKGTDHLRAGRLLELGHHRRRGGARADAIHPDSLRDDLEGSPHREDDDCLLRERVAIADLVGVGRAPGTDAFEPVGCEQLTNGAHVLHELEPGVRRDHGDRAAGRNRRLDALHDLAHRREVDRHDVEGWLGLGEAGAVEHAIDRPLERPERRVDLLLVAQVTERELRQLIVGLAVVDAVHGGTELLHDLGGRGAHPRVAADDEHLLAVVAESIRHLQHPQDRGRPGRKTDPSDVAAAVRMLSVDVSRRSSARQHLDLLADGHDQLVDASLDRDASRCHFAALEEPDRFVSDVRELFAGQQI